MRERYIQGIFNQYIGAREQARADLDVYLSNPVAIGEHSDIGEEIKKKIEEVDKYNSLVDTMNVIFVSSPDISVSPDVTDSSDN